MRRAAQIGFVVLALGFLAWGLHGRGHEIADGLSATEPIAVAGAVLLVLAGLLVTGVVWQRLLEGFGFWLPRRQAQSVFFAGQLGKYIPGSVWSIGAQAGLARAHRVPARVTAITSLVFLGLNLATATLACGLARVAGAWDDRIPLGLGLLGVAVGVAVLLPVNRLGSRFAGQPLALGPRDLAVLTLLMLAVWSLYGVALVLLAPVSALDPASVVLGIGAFAAAYAVGVVVVIAPAGVGAREAVLIGLLSPAVGVGSAAAMALLARVLHTCADLVLAAAAWYAAQRRGTVAGNAPTTPRG